MSDRRPTKARAERIVASKFRPVLGKYLGAIRRTDRLIYELLDDKDGRPRNNASSLVCSILLARLSNDLRACALLAARGHILQSWTIGASALESAYGIGFVGQDDARAQRWLVHKDSAKAPWPVFDALRATLTTFGLSENEQNFFASYRRLSAAKHANPVILSRWGVSRDPGATRIQVDPYFNAGAARAARFGIVWTLHGAGLGFWSFAHHAEVPERLANRVADFAALTLRLLNGVRLLPGSDAPAT